MNETSHKFVNYGDANPIEHGGFIVEDGTGQIVFFAGTCETGDDDLLVYRTHMDVAAQDWIDWEAVAASEGWLDRYASLADALLDLGPAKTLHAAVSYYGFDEFDSAPERIGSMWMDSLMSRHCDNWSAAT